MPSLTDIPTRLLDERQRDDFITWLVDMPVPIKTKIELMHLWQRHNRTTLPVEAYEVVKASGQ